MDFLTEETYNISFTRRQLDDGSTFLVPRYAAHRPACKAILNGKLFEPRTHVLVRLATRHLPGGVAHAGTFYGDMLPSFSKAVGANELVFAFEPLVENYVLSRAVVDINKLDNVLLMSTALGESIGICKMSNRFVRRPDLHAGGASKISEDGEHSAAMMTLDSLQIQKLAVLHLDVEGFELAAVNGAMATIKRCLPAILIEDNERACGRVLKEAGYRCVGRTPALFVWLHETHVSLRKDILAQPNMLLSPDLLK